MRTKRQTEDERALVLALRGMSIEPAHMVAALELAAEPDRHKRETYARLIAKGTGGLRQKGGARR